MTNDRVRECIDLLTDGGMSKVRIAEETGVTWMTVHLWHRGVFKPRLTKHITKLEELLIKQEKDIENETHCKQRIHRSHRYGVI